MATSGETLFQVIEAVEGSTLDVILKGKGIDPEILEVVDTCTMSKSFSFNIS